MIKYILMFCLSFPAAAETDWARIAMNTAVVMDWAQTRDIDNHPGLYEENRILGRYPSDAKINRFFIAELLIYNMVGEYLISEKYQAYFYGGVGLVHADAVLHNYSMGVKFQF